MPYRRRPFRRFRRYNRRRRRPGPIRRFGAASRYGGVRNLPVPVSRQFGCPDKMVVKMRFALFDGLSNSIASTSGALAEYVFRANDCYDPYQTGAGNQPRTFDQWMALYKHGVVLGSKIVCDFMYPTGATAENAMKLFIVPTHTTTATTIAGAVESRASKTKMLLAQFPKCRLVNTYTYKLLCHNPEDEDDLMFSDTGQPTQQWFYHVGGFALASATETCYVTGWIDYTVLLLHPINPSQS